MAEKGITYPGQVGAEVYFAGIPGVYAPGRVVPLASTGMSEKEVRALLAANPGCPLKIVDLPKDDEKGGEA